MYYKFDIYSHPSKDYFGDAEFVEPPIPGGVLVLEMGQYINVELEYPILSVNRSTKEMWVSESSTTIYGRR